MRLRTSPFNHPQCPFTQMTDTDVTFLPKYHNMDPSRLYVMILTSPPSLPLSRPWAGLGVQWPSQSHPVTRERERTCAHRPAWASPPRGRRVSGRGARWQQKQYQQNPARVCTELEGTARGGEGPGKDSIERHSTCTETLSNRHNLDTQNCQLDPYRGAPLN